MQVTVYAINKDNFINWMFYKTDLVNNWLRVANQHSGVANTPFTELATVANRFLGLGKALWDPKRKRAPS